ncbi:hypothetical protein ADL00_02500 [Streptomyces sp. AS58]|uniref:hypothetical protein n=1 Tax=Streptomyces sp. AS58 TaxID=1519489 RepID=UPI0006AF77FA|nr:hypothetical protein [Streptomyces sp. AS58]KOV74275.1 hypothetical protein ADL00_02500 [Streptomyces sp. AS58]
MSRLSREKKREQEHQAAPAAPAVDVHVPWAEAGACRATVGGVPVVAAPGEELHHAVLRQLHRIALAAGRPVLATVHDERIGYVVPLQVHPDGSSRYTGEPVRTGPAPAERTGPAPAEPAGDAGPAASGRPRAPHPSGPAAPHPAHESGADRDTHVFRTPAQRTESTPTFRMGAAGRSQPPGEGPRAVPPRPAPETQPAGDAVPTFPLRAVPEPQPLGEAVPTFPLRAVPGTAVPGSAVTAPTGAFGPPPVMGGKPHPETPAPPRSDTDPRPTPPRGFDAVAEAILGDAPADEEPSGPALLAEPIARIGEAVRAGRIDAAAALAEQTAGEASATLPPDHPELLGLLELTAYIAYLAADPVRSFRLSLDVVRVHRRLGDAEAAYGNVQSAATSWRAVREPSLGLEMGRELIGLWTELVGEGGPAAEDMEELESARARMGRLTDRAKRTAGN